mmetsp:Transcript_86671/g.253676  ORF Transcript_86671/g.253676 Transcript_86671/m.253676 type:complete len:220 (-) Transcript_86671:1205-1864(-)
MCQRYVDRRSRGPRHTGEGRGARGGPGERGLCTAARRAARRPLRYGGRARPLHGVGQGVSLRCPGWHRRRRHSGAERRCHLLRRRHWWWRGRGPARQRRRSRPGARGAGRHVRPGADIEGCRGGKVGPPHAARGVRGHRGPLRRHPGRRGAADGRRAHRGSGHGPGCGSRRRGQRRRPRRASGSWCSRSCDVPPPLHHRRWQAVGDRLLWRPAWDALDC